MAYTTKILLCGAALLAMACWKKKEEVPLNLGLASPPAAEAAEREQQERTVALQFRFQPGRAELDPQHQRNLNESIARATPLSELRGVVWMPASATLDDRALARDRVAYLRQALLGAPLSSFQIFVERPTADGSVPPERDGGALLLILR